MIGVVNFGLFELDGTVNLLIKGFVQGLVFGMLALGIVLIYRTSGVINFAVGNMGIIATALFALMVVQWNFPFWLALALALVIGVIVGLLIELAVIRRLFRAPRVIVLVATIGVAQMAQAILLSLPDIDKSGAKFPAVSVGKKFTPFDDPGLGLWESTSRTEFTISVTQLQIIVVVPLVSLGLAWLLNRTMVGKAIAAAASNSDAARLAGINPKMVSTFVWCLAGFLATLSAILLSSNSGSVNGLENLGPNTLVRALAAAAFARMVSFPRAIVAGVAIGIVQSLVTFNFSRETGLIDFLIFVAVVVAIALQTRGRSSQGTEVLAFAPRITPVPERLKELWWVRNLPKIMFGVALAVAIIGPLFVTLPSRHFLYATIICYAICALSLTVLTGWAGQLSLSQMAFAGLSALFAAAMVRGAEVDLGGASSSQRNFLILVALLAAAGAVHTQVTGAPVQRYRWFGAVGAIAVVLIVQQLFFEDLRFIATFPQVPFSVTVFAGAAMGALFAAVIGVGALRVRGLLLAVSTLAFGLAAQQYLYRRPFFSGGQSGSVPFRRGWIGIPNTKFFTMPGFALGPWQIGPYDIGSVDLGYFQRNYYYFCLALLVVALIVVSRLRRSGVGRSLIGVRDNADGAASYTIPPARTKLTAFVLGGVISGIGGAALAGSGGKVPISEPFFQNSDSLALVSIVVIGGIGSVAGPVVGALWVIGLPAFFPGNDEVRLFTSSIGLLILLLYFPGGLVQIGYFVRDTLFRWMEARLPEQPSKTVHTPPAALTRHSDRPPPEPDGPLPLAATSVTVKFGKFIAVDDVTLEARPGEVVGLIGTNGAGKSTLLNAIGGYVPASGTIELFGKDVSGTLADKRAKMGLGRTFQAATLFPELTVRETVQLALESRARAGIFSTALALPHATKRERRKAAEARELIDFLGLGRYADRYIAELSTGTRRIVELAGLLALDARVLCLDEPTAGVAQKETEAFGPLIVAIRAELQATMIIIEHDMPLITAISDRLYCLEAGTVIAEGSPDDIRNNPLVIASYLGTDTRALERSDTVAP